MCRRAATLWLLCLTLLQVALAVDPFGFSVGIWTPLNSTGGGPQPSARRWHSITALDSGSFVLFGGREDGFTSASNGSTSTTQTTRYLNDVWLFTFSAGRKIEWKELVKQEDDLLIPSGRPAARYAHSAIVRRSGGKQFLVIYGGYSPLCGDYCSDMWELDIEAKTWKQWTKYSGSAAAADPYTLKCSPDKWIGRRWRHVAEAYGPYMLVFGGFRSWQDPDESSVGFLNDLWEIDFGALARTATRLQPAVSGSFSLSDLSRVSPGSVLNPGSGSGKTGTLFVFGGYRSNSATPADGVWLNDLYSYNHLANEWKLETFANPAGRSTPIPSERYGPTMFAYAEVLGIFGGRDSNNADLGDVWMFNTTSRYWTEFEYKQLVTSAGLWPAGRSRHAGASMGDSRVVVFGGSSEGPNIADPWLLDLDRCKADCSGHGACVRGYCVCDPGFFGPDCSGRYCPDSTCTYDYVLHKQTCAHCSSRGSCDGSVVDAAGKGLCVCREPSTGYKCELTLCPQNCTVKASVNSLGGGASIPQGTAPFILQYGRIESWDFNAYEPYANGLCNANGTCTCYDPFRGTDCSLRSGCKDVTADNYDAEATVSLDICKHASVVVLPRSTVTLVFNISCTVFLSENLAENVTEAFNEAFKCTNCYISDIKCGSTIVTMVIGDTLKASSAAGLAGIAADPSSAVNVAATVFLYMQNQERLQAFKDMLKNINVVYEDLIIDGTYKPRTVLPDTPEQRQALTKQKLAAQTTGSTTTAKKEEPTSYLWVFGLVWLAVFIIP